MTNTVKTETDARTTAKIYAFPDRRRTASAGPVATEAKAKTVPWGGGWYHEVAIEEEHLKPAVGPAA